MAGFRIPNATDASYLDLARLTSSDLDAITRGIRGEGVVSGCEVSAQSPVASGVDVAPGVARVNGVEVSVSAGPLSLSAASPAQPRLDVVAVNVAGNAIVVVGAPSGDPVVGLPDDVVPLALVLRPAANDTVAANQIVDKRVLVERRWRFVHAQIAAAAVWTVTHNLGGYPSVTTQDSTGKVVYGSVRYLDENTVQVTFSAAMGGKLGLS